jgi:hypothetical protein
LSEGQEYIDDFLSTDYTDVDKMVDEFSHIVSAAASKCNIFENEKATFKIKKGKAYQKDKV